MKKLFFISLILFESLVCNLKGQSSIGIDQNTFSYSFTDSVYFGNTDVFAVTLKNYGPQAYSGSIPLYFALDTSVSGNNSLAIIDSVTFNFSIPVNGTAPDTGSIVIDTLSNFRSGINTVVIWPRSSSFLTHDSLKLSVWVVGYAGINNILNAEKPIVFPNPMQNRLFIANKDPDFVIEQVRIFDITGQLMYTELFKGSIDVSKLASGVYTLEFCNKAGKTARYKVIKE